MTLRGLNRTQEAGFSLVELLISFVLVSMVAGLFASGLSIGQRSWQRSEEKAQASRTMFDAESALRRLLDNLQPLHLRSTDSSSRAIDFRGSSDELEGIVPLPPHIGLGGLYRFHVFRDRGARRLDLTFHAFEPGSADTSGRDDNETGLTTLSSEIDGLEFRYFGKAKGEETQNWRSDWQGQEELPALISIKIKGGIVWPELLIAPRVKSVEWR